MKKLKMKPNTTSGLLFTFCGLDGCGKTTMLERLVNELKDEYNLFITKQPTDSVRQSDIFRTYMDSPDHSAYDYRSLSLLAASDRIQHTNKEIVPAMKEGKIVISDRYFYSCLANLNARGFCKDKWIFDIAESIVKPDIAFFFDTSVETAVSRVRLRESEKNRYIDLDLQHKLRDQYINICKTNKGVLISTDITPDETFAKVINQIRKVLKKYNGNNTKSKRNP